MALTLDIVKALRAPFDAEAIKWKVQTNPKEGDKDQMAVVVCYLDARDVAERLDLATGGDWSSDFAQPQVIAGNGISLECRLTVCGVTRVDVGTVAQENRGDNTKDLYSDALKRAAVQFGVGSHIYRFPTVKARVEKFGNSFFLTFDAQRELLALTRAILSNAEPAKYKDIKVRGSAYGAEGLRDEEAKPAQFEQPRERAIQGAQQRTSKPNAPAQPPRDEAEARRRFFAKYGEQIGASDPDDWKAVCRYLRVSEDDMPEPGTIQGWIEAAEAVRGRQPKAA